MSLIKLTWARKKNTSGSEVVHSVSYRGHKCEVINFPGTRTMFSAVYLPSGETWHSETHDKAECGVETAKEKCLNWLDETLNKLQK